MKVRIHAVKTRCGIWVQDDGVGFCEGERKSGLLNLARRAEENGGAFEIRQLSQGGTEAVWSIEF